MKAMVVACAALLALAAFLAGCGGSEANNKGAPAQTDGGENGRVDELRSFTLEELAEFDGRDGRPAYVAVDGTVYDVSGSSRWPKGNHTPCNLDAMAGRDLSEEIKQAPANMRSLLQRFPVVGTLEE